MLQPGTKLNDTYTLIEEIGSGGGGIVYKAYHERLQVYVVVKQVKDRVKGILDARGEADVLKNIKHTRLPRVYDFLELDGEIFTVMDFIPGESLDKVLAKEYKFSQKEVFTWTVRLAEALSYLHSVKPPVIHSDIKPANVMLTPDRDVCLIDFNVSLAFNQEMRMSTGVSRGYSPPEQYRDLSSYFKGLNKVNSYDEPTAAISDSNEPTVAISNSNELIVAISGSDETVALNGETAVIEQSDSGQTESIISQMVGRGVDERSDVYSLGATVYHLLTGRNPGVDFDEITPIRELMPQLSEGFAVIIEKMMALDPEKRYQNGTELLYALEHVYELDSEYQNYCRKNRLRKLLITGMFAAGVAMSAGGFLLMGQENTKAYNRSIEKAQSLIEAGKFEEADELIQKARLRLPGDIHSYKEELLCLFSMGEYEKTVSYGKDILNNPSYTVEGEEEQAALGDIFYILGNAYFEQEDYTNAGACFERAISQNQKNSMYFRDEAIVQAKSGNSDAGEETLKKAIALGLGEDSIYMVQGEIAFSRGEYEEAVKHLKESVQTAETDELRRRAVILCAQAYKRMGDEWLSDEIKLLEEAENTFTLQTSMHISEMLADAYARKAKADESQSEKYYEMALARFKDLYEKGYSTEQMMENIAILYQQTERLEEANAVLLEMAEKYPKDYKPYKRLAFLEADRQQKKENTDRDYSQMKEYYDLAKELYEETGNDGDTEMMMLENMIQDLKKGGWL